MAAHVGPPCRAVSSVVFTASGLARTNYRSVSLHPRIWRSPASKRGGFRHWSVCEYLLEHLVVVHAKGQVHLLNQPPFVLMRSDHRHAYRDTVPSREVHGRPCGCPAGGSHHSDGWLSLGHRDPRFAHLAELA